MTVTTPQRNVKSAPIHGNENVHPQFAIASPSHNKVSKVSTSNDEPKEIDPLQQIGSYLSTPTRNLKPKESRQIAKPAVTFKSPDRSPAPVSDMYYRILLFY